MAFPLTALRSVCEDQKARQLFIISSLSGPGGYRDRFAHCHHRSHQITSPTAGDCSSPPTTTPVVILAVNPPKLVEYFNEVALKVAAAVPSHSVHFVGQSTHRNHHYFCPYLGQAFT